MDSSVSVSSIPDGDEEGSESRLYGCTGDLEASVFRDDGALEAPSFFSEREELVRVERRGLSSSIPAESSTVGCFERLRDMRRLILVTSLLVNVEKVKEEGQEEVGISHSSTFLTLFIARISAFLF